MRSQRFGIEIEMTGITRAAAAKVIAGHFDTTATHVGGFMMLTLCVMLRGVNGRSSMTTPFVPKRSGHKQAMVIIKWSLCLPSAAMRI